MVVAGAPTQAAAAPPVGQMASATPQFVTPGGVIAQPADALTTTPSAGMQRLPSGGVSANESYIR
jgi:hypothetical protein